MSQTNMSTVDHLLIPRIKIITPWPYMDKEVKVGDIIYEDCFGRYAVGEGKWIYNPRRFHANVRQLFWWEERKPEDLPRFIKVDDRLYEVLKYEPEEDDIRVYLTENPMSSEMLLRFHDALPATEQEYLNYQAKIKSNGK